MAINVIKKVEHRVKCPKCQAQLEYGPEDIQRVGSDQDQGEEAYSYIQCPNCRRVIHMQSDWQKDVEDSRYW